LTEKQQVSVGGIWLRKATYSSNSKAEQLEVLAEVDGEWRLLLISELDNGPISHIVEPGGIRSAPLDPLTER
jgi:hypothetical protein